MNFEVKETGNALLDRLTQLLSGKDASLGDTPLVPKHTKQGGAELFSMFMPKAAKTPSSPITLAGFKKIKGVQQQDAAAVQPQVKAEAAKRKTALMGGKVQQELKLSSAWTLSSQETPKSPLKSVQGKRLAVAPSPLKLKQAKLVQPEEKGLAVEHPPIEIKQKHSVISPVAKYKLNRPKQESHDAEKAYLVADAVDITIARLDAPRVNVASNEVQASHTEQQPLDSEFKPKLTRFNEAQKSILKGEKKQLTGFKGKESLVNQEPVKANRLPVVSNPQNSDRVSAPVQKLPIDGVSEQPRVSSDSVDEVVLVDDNQLSSEVPLEQAGSNNELPQKPTVPQLRTRGGPELSSRQAQKVSESNSDDKTNSDGLIRKQLPSKDGIERVEHVVTNKDLTSQGLLSNHILSPQANVGTEAAVNGDMYANNVIPFNLKPSTPLASNIIQLMSADKHSGESKEVDLETTKQDCMGDQGHAQHKDSFNQNRQQGGYQHTHEPDNALSTEAADSENKEFNATVRANEALAIQEKVMAHIEQMKRNGLNRTSLKIPGKSGWMHLSFSGNEIKAVIEEQDGDGSYDAVKDVLSRISQKAKQQYGIEVSVALNFLNKNKQQG